MFVLRTLHRPLLYGFSWGRLSMDDVDSMYAAYRAIHTPPVDKMVQIHDLRGAELPPPDIRKALGQMANSFEAETKANILAVVLVIDSRIIKGGIQVLRWLTAGWLEMQVERTATSALAAIEKMNVAVDLPSGARNFVRGVDRAYAAGEDLARFRTRREDEPPLGG